MSYDRGRSAITSLCRWIERVDASAGTVYREFGGHHKGDVVNIIAPQKAGEIVHTAGLVNADCWCPVNQDTFESTVHRDNDVIGDSCVAEEMPKSGFAANSQAKVCAAAVVASLTGQPMPEPSYINKCYSLIAPDYGISVAGVYRLTDQGIVKVEGDRAVSAPLRRQTRSASRK